MQRAMTGRHTAPRAGRDKARLSARLLAAGWTAVFSLLMVMSGIGEAGGAGGFAAHLIPVLILIALVSFAWRYEWTGGWLLACIGGVAAVIFPILSLVNNGMTSTGLTLVLIQIVSWAPFVIAGGLFADAARKDRSAPVTG